MPDLAAAVEDRQTASRLTRQTIRTAIDVVGLDTLVGDACLYVNATIDTLADKDHVALPRDRTILELNAGQPFDEAAVAVCRGVRDAGYRIALDHHEPGSAPHPLIRDTDYIKIDFTRGDIDQALAAAEPARLKGARLIAEKIETHEAFDLAVDKGFDLMQGYFFCHPQTVHVNALTANEADRVRFLAELNRSPIDMQAVEELVRRDAVLSAGLLRYLNSAGLGLRQRVTSIRHALLLLGERPLRQWASLIAVAELGRRKSNQLLLTSLGRARFCERMAYRLGEAERATTLFLMGLLSLLDALTDQPMERVLNGVPVEDGMRDALLGRPAGRMTDLLALVRASERGAWGTVRDTCVNLCLTHREVAEVYFETLRWADEQLAAARSKT